MVDPGSDDLLDVHRARQPLIEGEHVAAECHLQVGVFVELVDGHIGDFAAFEFEDDAHAIFVRFVADIGNAGECVLSLTSSAICSIRARFVDVVRDLIDDEALSIAVSMIFDADHAAQDDLAAACVIGFFDAAVAANDAACREIGSRHHFHDLVDRRLRIVENEKRALISSPKL